MKILLVANAAGGVGKTTTAHACAVAATEYGKKVLAIDADVASGLTFSAGVENPRLTTKEFLTKEFSLEATAVRTSERFMLIPSSSRLAALDFSSLISAEKFREITQDFDLVVIDSPTGFSQLTNYFAHLADLILAPTSTEILSVRGALQTRDFAVNAGFAGKLQLLITKHSEPIDEAVISQLRVDFEVLAPAMRFGKEAYESQTQGKSLLTTANQSELAADYREVTYTLLEQLALI